MARWVANLSNGKTLVENEGVLKEEIGGRSPWFLLEDYLRKSKCKITMMYVDCKGRIYYPPKAITYRGLHKAIQDQFMGGVTKHTILTGVRAIFDDKAIDIWVDDENGNSEASVVKLDDKDKEVLDEFG